MNETVERILELLKSSGMTAKELTSRLNMSATSVTDWKKGKAQPSVDGLKKIAEHFNVSLDYLVYGKEIADQPSGFEASLEEQELINCYRHLSEVTKAMLLGYVSGACTAEIREETRIYL